MNSNVQAICKLHYLALFQEFTVQINSLVPYLDDGGKRKLRSIVFQLKKDLENAKATEAKVLFDEQYKQFYELLPLSLTAHERRLTTLLAMGYNVPYISEILMSTVNTITVAFYRIRAKFNLLTTNELKTYAKSLYSKIESRTSSPQTQAYSNGSNCSGAQCKGGDCICNHECKEHF